MIVEQRHGHRDRTRAWLMGQGVRTGSAGPMTGQGCGELDTSHVVDNG